MSSDLIRAAGLLEEGGYTCVLCKGESVLTRVERGVRPLMKWLDAGEDLREFTAADKVVGRAAAFLYIVLGVKVVYAPVMSEGALYTLARHGVQPVCDKTVKTIINRTGTGICPMEQAVAEILEPEEAVKAIRARMSELLALTHSHLNGRAV